MRSYWDNKRRCFILDLWNGTKGVELTYFRPKWTIRKVNAMANSFNNNVLHRATKSLTEWDKVFNDFEGVI